MTHHSQFPEFRPRAPWFGPDLQTLRNALVARDLAVEAGEEKRVLLPLSDGSGDQLAALLSAPAGTEALASDSGETARSGASPPLVVLIHGLSGCEESAYMCLSARHWLARGHAVLRLNLRGAGPSREHCALQYHAGQSADLRDALAALPPGLLGGGLVLVGYSLGGNMLLKFLAEYGADFPVRAAASVSAPIDLAAASQRFLAPRNRLYHLHLLRNMKRECFGGAARVSESERQRVLEARSIYAFDETFVAPRNGFRNAEHYYEENHARRFLSDISTPTLVIHARNDPWIPADTYTSYPWSSNPNLTPLLASGGGHVGFHERNAQSGTWYDRCVALFLAEVDARAVA